MKKNAKKSGRGRRSHGSGTLERRRGFWLARWTVDGRRFSQALGTADRAEAERRLAAITAPFRLATDEERLQLMAAKIEGTRRERKRIEDEAPAVKIADAWDIYAESPERPETSEKYKADGAARWRTFASFMADRFPSAKELRHVTREHAATFMAEYGKTRSAYTYNLFCEEARRLWAFMADHPGAKLPTAAPCPFARIARRRNAPTSRRALTADELARVCSYVQGEHRALFAIGIYTGLRLKDCCLLKWGSVDLLRRLVTVTPHKTARLGKVVSIPIHPALFAVLAETPELKRRGYVLPKIAGEYGAGLLTSRIRRIFDKCGIETRAEAVNGRGRCLVGFHSLRHTFVSMAANAGAPLAVVQRIVGHASQKMTEHYFHETTRALNAAVSLLPDVLGRTPTAALPPPSQPGDGSAATSALDRFKAAADALPGCDVEAAMLYFSQIAKAKAATAATIDVQ